MTSMKKNNDEDILIVGLGASAGGLDPIKRFVDLLPDKTGMAFVVVMHMDPHHDSKVAEILQKHTQLKTLQVTESCEIKADHIYVTPSDKLLFVKENHLELSVPEGNEQSLAAIDAFFRSLGNTAKKNAASIVLSGTGADGSVGIKSVKEQGGLTIAQQPDEADYSSMTRSAIKTGVVDKVLPVKKMYTELNKYKENLSQVDLFEAEERGDILHAISEKLKSQTGHDFSNYKESTVLRRIERRMQVTDCQSLRDYLDFLEEHPDENEELFKDLLISVTSFFRDREAFEALKKIIPQLFKKKDPEASQRIWVPGTATGEEAYSIAILLQDYMNRTQTTANIQIFASDIDRAALKQARKGIYPESIAATFTEEQLNRYFEKEGHEYYIRDEIREMVLFTSHNLLSDPPFSSLDLIACRNVLIYMKKNVQSEIFQLFEYALRPGGLLFLGMSDSNIGAEEFFEPVDTKHRIFQKSPKHDTKQVPPQLPLQFKDESSEAHKNTSEGTQQETDIAAFHQNLLMRLYAPQSVIINNQYEVIHTTENIQQYLKYKDDLLNKNILSIVRSDLHKVLQTLLHQFGASTGQNKAVVDTERKDEKIEITVRNIGRTGFTKNLMQVVFKEVEVSQKYYMRGEKSETAGASEAEDNALEKLKNELKETDEQLQVTEEEYKMANEQLQTSNEELQSLNEELQTVNEELETSQEELQAVNNELESKVQELSRVNSDLKNLMEATEVAILILDKKFRVKRFTDSVKKIFNLIPSDKGRPLDDVTHKLNYDLMKDDLEHVLDTNQNVEKVISSKEGHTFIMRLRPYHSIEDEVEGVVFSLMEITELKEAEKKLKQQKFQEALVTMGTYALSSDDLKSIIDRGQQQICAVLNTEFGVHLLWNEEEQVLELSGWAGWEPEENNGKFEPDSKWDMGSALEKETPIMIPDYTKEDRFSLLPIMDHLNIRSGVVVRITESNKICGVLGAYTKEKRSFTDEVLKFIQNVANIVGMASERLETQQSLKITNKKLEKEIERSEKYQQEILQNSIAERWNLGGYLHDNLAQDLVSIKVMISSLKAELEDTGREAQLDMIIENIDQGIDDIRNLTHEIIPVDIEDEGVEHAFRLLVRQLQKTHGINCILEVGEVIDLIRDKKVATNLYHIIQEAVKNAAIHGKAGNVIIETAQKDDNLELRITDDGIGLSQSDDKSNGGSGTNIMRHRIELLGGSFKRTEISEGDETGTRVICTLPLDQLGKREKDNTDG